MAGYDAGFLGNGLIIPLPDFSPALTGSILRSPALDGDVFAHYVNYTVAMNRETHRRSAVFAALNIDQTQIRGVTRSDRWRLDSRIGAEFQLDNDYYHDNPWDRGHLARRASAAWGASNAAAGRASDETFYFSNATLQHKNYNQDEWLALETWVLELDHDSDGHISTFSGPIYDSFVRSIEPEGRPLATVPSAFFKVVCFKNAKLALEVRAFIIEQDTEAMSDRSGRTRYDNQRYQVTVAEIEARTGLLFPAIVAETNPLYFNPPTGEDVETVALRASISHFPEAREVDSAAEVLGPGGERTVYADDDVDVFIAAAMVNPKGSEREGEWVSIANLSADPVTLTGWTLSDTKRGPLALSGTLGPGEAVRVQPIRPLMLTNRDAAVIELYDDRGRRIDRVRYSREQARVEGRPVIFAYRSDELYQAPRPTPGGDA